MATEDDNQYVLNLFIDGRPELMRLVQGLTPQAEAVLDEAESIYTDMIADSAYLDDPRSAFAAALFYCSINLAVFLALKPHGVDVHKFGSAMLEALRHAQPPARDESAATDRAWHQGPGTHPGEFKVELVPSKDQDFDWGYNITSCAICHQFSRYDAMELVPYMCASDDVVSDQGAQGLRRTGTIALGAHHCDFRYQAGGEPQRVAQLYPQRIKFVHEEQ